MKYNFFSIRINVAKYDVIFTTKGSSNPPPWLCHCVVYMFSLHSEQTNFVKA